MVILETEKLGSNSSDPWAVLDFCGEKGPQGGNGVGAGTTNYPGAAVQPQFISAGFRGDESGRSVSHSVDPLNIYYDSQWSRRAGISARVFWAEDRLQQLIETRTNGTANSNVTSQMVWSAAYPGAATQPRHPASAGFRVIDRTNNFGSTPNTLNINAPVLQDSYTAGVIQPNSRLYFTQDANWDTTSVVSLVGGTWQVVQRYVYSPYGTITILNANWSATPTGTVPLVNNLFQGMANDPVTGLYYERARWYSPSLGTWISQDPAGYINGANTYQFVGGDPANAVDPAGLEAHHFVPQQFWNPWAADPLPFNKDVRDVFRKAIVDAPGHVGFRSPHPAYNEAVGKALDKFMRDKDISCPGKMTPEQAKEFVDSIKNSADPVIHGFLQNIGAIKTPEGVLGKIWGAVKSGVGEAGKAVEDIGQGLDKFLNEFSGPYPILMPPGFPGSPFNQHRTYYGPTV